MELTVQKLSELINGEVEGDSEIKIKKISKIEEAGKGAVTFLANPKYTPFIYTTKASVVIVNKDFIAEKELKTTLIRVKDAYVAFSNLLTKFNDDLHNKTGIEEPAYISKDVEVGENVFIGAFAYIGKGSKIGKNVKIFSQVYIGENVTIGDNTILHPGVKIYTNCQIGKKCIFHASTVIGGDGFGFAPQTNGEYKKVAQTGNVIIEDNVEIGSHTTIDRATIGSTVIKSGVKLDNLIQIAHNVEIGEHTVVAAQTGIAGSTKIGKNCMIGGQVGIVGHITIADNTKIGAQTGVMSPIINEGNTLLGSPAIEIKEYMKSFAVFKKLPDIEKKVNELNKNGNGSQG